MNIFSIFYYLINKKKAEINIKLNYLSEKFTKLKEK